MKYRFIMHIGPHKTGSTYIQRTLFDNSGIIIDAGLEYSGVMKQQHIAHHDLAEKLYTKKYDAAAKIIDAMKASERDIVVSSENFDRLDYADVAFLDRILHDRKVEIVFYKRRLDDLLISSWQESIKHGQVHSWAKYCFRHILRPFSSEVLNAAKLLDVYAAVFGIENIKVIDFDNAKNAKRDICDLLFEAIGLPGLQGIGTGAQVNRSMPYSMVEIIRVLNVRFHSIHKKSPNHKLRDRYLDYYTKHKNNTLIRELQEAIDNNLQPLDLNNVWVLDFLNKEFQKKYESCIVNPSTARAAPYENSYSLPNESWYMDTKTMQIIENLFQLIESNSA